MDAVVWRSFFDGLFFISSALLAIFFGAALANVIRGVPLGEDGYFFLPLWTNWRVGPEPGVLDWYSVLGEDIASVALAVHGALYLSNKDRGRTTAAREEFHPNGLGHPGCPHCGQLASFPDRSHLH